MDPIQYRSSDELKALSRLEDKKNKRLADQLRKMKEPAVDQLFHPLHEEAFQQFDCLVCANCCKTISPIVTEKDIDRLARHFRMKPSAFIDQYLHIDCDKDYVFNQTPCPFLMSDNYCMAYESRPKACREYPHTDRRNMRQILKLTLKNCEVCPIVHGIISELKK
ncbi:MAG: YkgJ family cysteine cluster protein [Bacteroidales bacterium]|nr:YkgJ family cysteine cluster protein [Bacteroidales bacterium]